MAAELHTLMSELVRKFRLAKGIHGPKAAGVLFGGCRGINIREYNKG